MSKFYATLLVCLLATSHLSASGEFAPSDSDKLLKQAQGKAKHMSTAQITRDIDETMEVIEAIAHQMKTATKEEIADVWAAGTRDFKMDKALVKDSRKACEATLKALDLEGGFSGVMSAKNAELSKELREDARDHMREYHKKKSEAYVRDMRNWLTISEGVLRQANDKRELKK